MIRAPWPGPARKPYQPPPERDELMAECLRAVGLEFACFACVVAAVLAVVALAGCQSVTITRGDETTKVTAFMTKVKLTTSCAQYDPSGNLLAQTSQDFGSEGDVAMLHEAGSIFAQGMAAAVKLGGKAVAPVPGIRGMVASPDGRSVTACNGEHTTAIPMLEAKEP